MVFLKSKIREIPDWPKKGINFKDITTLLQDKDAFSQVVDTLTSHHKKKKIEKVVGIDARGFLIAAPVAYNLHAGLSIIRKQGKLPFDTIEQEYALEYGRNVIQIHRDAILPNESVILIDDLIATGGTALTSCKLIEKLSGKIIGINFIIDLSYLGGSDKLRKMGYKVKSLVIYDKK